MAVNPLDAIVGFVLKFLFSIIIGFVTMFIAILLMGNIGNYLLAKITASNFQPWTMENTNALLNAALDFMLSWMPHIWYMFQWVLWLLTGGRIFDDMPEPTWT